MSYQLNYCFQSICIFLNAEEKVKRLIKWFFYGKRIASSEWDLCTRMNVWVFFCCVCSAGAMPRHSESHNNFIFWLNTKCNYRKEWTWVNVTYIACYTYAPFRHSEMCVSFSLESVDWNQLMILLLLLVLVVVKVASHTMR